MTAPTRCALVLGTWLPVVAAVAVAQRGRMRLDAPTFVFARYATASSAALYAARGFGAGGAFVAMVQDAQTQYRELIGGAFAQARWGEQTLLVAVAYADATDGRYVQTYLNPSFASGPVGVSGTIEWYAPTGHAGTSQIGVNPLTLLVRVSERLALGPAGTVWAQVGAAPQYRAGGAVEWSAPWGSVRLEAFHRSADGRRELRTGVLALF